MKMKGDTITVIVLFAVIIGIVLWISYASSAKSSPIYTPYTPYTPIRNYATFEGYENINYSDKDAKEANVIDMTVSEPSRCVQLSGWKGSGTFCSPDGDSAKIDIFSQANGDLNCNNKSSGYHNSKGGLCLDENMMNLLQTRGENATGGYGQIGTGEA
jgi:hypothetical protein